ncbi:hypothetical protein [Streptomyces shenzhenensis]|uniref:Uncharacterized protein n=1 Tax=Streptomyces shenzhenensis TaxID=943815 RepID=A0A3M0I7Q7_9ACTN|nr:hypothetical protein [Streptomyces shenzhenensis]RMB85591.1 hypothetical protein CTZ28_12420 [Streptomyces shenzhenensis]
MSARADAFREAADLIEQAQASEEAEEKERHGFLDHETGLQGAAVRDKAAYLRRLADEVEGKSSRTAADATPDKLTAREHRLAQLLDTIRTHGGKWSSSSVQQIRRATGGPVQRGTADRDLIELTRRGHLAQHGAADGRYYTLKRKGGPR